MNPAVAANLPAAASGPWRQVPLTRPAVGAGELAQLAAVLDSGWLTQGPRVAAFEEQVARLCDSRYAVAVSSCTAALHLALLACGVQPGDEVVLPALSFVATANAVNRKILEITRLDRELEVFSGLVEAVKSFRAGL